MTDEETIQKLMSLRLTTMAQAFRDQLADAPGSQLSFSERVALMVDREWTDRDNRRLARLMRSAHLSVSDAAMENIWCDPARGIDKAAIRDLATCKWIKNKQNVVVVGKTGVGKTFFAAALAQAACRNGLRALCTRVPRLLHEISIARADGTYAATLGRLAKLDVLVLDDFLIAPLKDQERRDLVEVLAPPSDTATPEVACSHPPSFDRHRRGMRELRVPPGDLTVVVISMVRTAVVSMGECPPVQRLRAPSRRLFFTKATKPSSCDRSEANITARNASRLLAPVRVQFSPRTWKRPHDAGSIAATAVHQGCEL